MKNYINQEALDEAIKEFMRVMMAGIVPTYTATTGAIILGINQSTGAFDIRWSVVAAIFVVALLGLVGSALVRAYDRYIHVNPDIKSQGFLPK